MNKKQHAILTMLADDKELYGLDMVKESNGLLGRGTVYVTLSRMEDEGLIVSRLEPAPKHPGLARRLYSITEVGKSAIKAAKDST